MDDTIILFDLDGTLTDSGEGIINCAILALSHFGLPIPDRDTLRVFVGPPLKDSFIRFGVDPERLTKPLQFTGADIQRWVNSRTSPTPASGNFWKS